MNYRIKEHSLLARVAAWKLGSKQVAIVVGKTIYLHNTSRDEFLSNKAWLNHELQHIRQYKKYGLLPFIIRYLVESARKGYYNNKYEIEAREAERNATLE